MGETRTIYLAGGCFWGIEALMRRMPGVRDTCVGYANGTGEADATYETVCSGKTDFREAVRVRFDPTQTSVDALVFALADVIDPAARDRQGNDVGTQYQAGVFWEPEDAATREDVERVLALVAHRTPGFAMERGPLQNFFPAEDYHQDYLEKNPRGYCHVSPALMRALASGRIDPGRYQRPADEELAESLTPEQLAVTQRAATESPFGNAYWDADAPGIYVDVVTGEPLFSSVDKYASSCGWPAFSAPIEAGVVAMRQDRSHGMVREEVLGRTSGSHLGHVFDHDPESPTGVRYCMNSAALRFVPRDRMEAEGYGYLLGE
jgi:peptide methionine sulfoxide reductase msrA/msrB